MKGINMGDVAPPSDAGAAGAGLGGLLVNWHPQAPNLNILGALQQGQALEQARLANQRLEGQRALGLDYERSINPLTGQPDAAKFGALLSHDPAAAWDAQQGVHNAIANAASGYNLHMTKFKAFTDSLGAALAESAKNPAGARGYAQDAINTAVAENALTPSEGATLHIELTKVPNADLIPTMQQLAYSLDGAKKSAEGIVGQFGVFDQNGQLVPYRLTPYGNPTPAGAVIPKTLSPGESVRFEHLTGPNGQPVNITEGAVGRAQGVPPSGYNPLIPNVTAAQTTGAPPNANPLLGGAPALPHVNIGTGRPGSGHSLGTLPPNRNPSAEIHNETPATNVATTPQTPNNSSGGATSIPSLANGVVMGPKPGVVTGLEAAARQQADIGNQIVAEGRDVTQTVSNLEDLGAQINDANPGPLADAAAKYRAALNELGIPYGNKQATAAQVFTKLTNVLASQNLSGLGAGTDQKLMTVLHATPNTAMTNQAAKTVVAMAIGVQKYRQARYEAYEKWLGQGNLPSNAAAFNDQFQNEVSPLVAAIPYMPKGQQQALQKYLLSLPKAAQAAFVKQVQGARALGLVP